ncbi:MAG: hypothetical protein HY556_08235 [Euryarchaeota archaeon]|nr:hypothetical protein [Euryarchaeota archaeon]
MARSKDVGAAVALAGILLVSGCLGFDLGGSSGSQETKVSERYADADFRFARATSGSSVEHPKIIVKEGTAVLTIKVSWETTGDFGWTLTNPEGGVESRFNAIERNSARHMNWLHDTNPKKGIWNLTIECEAACEYSFGFYFNDAVQPPLVPIPTKFKDAPSRVQGSSKGGSQTHALTVSPDVSKLRFRMSVDAKDGFNYKLTDAKGKQQSSLGFDFKVGIEDTEFTQKEPYAVGEWHVDVGCVGSCVYAFAFYEK